MDPIEIAPGVFNVGVQDWNIRDFHGYSTDLGTTYNAFLVIDEKITLIDSVKKEFGDQLLANIAAVVDPRKIDMLRAGQSYLKHLGEDFVRDIVEIQVLLEPALTRWFVGIVTEEHIALTEQWLRGEIEVAEIAGDRGDGRHGQKDAEQQGADAAHPQRGHRLARLDFRCDGKDDCRNGQKKCEKEEPGHRNLPRG